jgi:2,4-dienoyl-CoA reductase-like NADH-dependent reductase (Old Yellow Enzyme family)
MSVLFDKMNFKGVELNNRLVRSATHEAMADENGFPTKNLFKLYERLAKGGVGLIITGYTFVSRDGKSRAMLGIDTDKHVSKYRELVDQVHRNGAKIAMQINHCGRQTTKDMTGTQTIAPSAVKDNSFLDTPREMTEQDIENVIEAFAMASKRVKDSNFDAVQLHGAHGFLINQFLCPHTNRRKDKWGGSIENRMRFLKKIYKACRNQVGDEYPIFIKISAYDNMKNGIKEEEGIIIAEMMSDMGFDAIEVSCGIGEDGGSTLRGGFPIDVALDTWPMYKKQNALLRFIMRHFGEKIVKPVPFSQGFNRDVAKKIKSKVNVPIFLVGGMIDPSVMVDVIECGDADYISLSRALVNNPKFPNKIQEGNMETSKCIHCNLCLFGVISSQLRCHYGNKDILLHGI